MDTNHVNTVHLVGRLLDQTELQVDSDGHHFIIFTIRTRDVFLDVQVHEAVAWDLDAEDIARRIKPGGGLAISGTICVDRFQKQVSQIHVETMRRVGRRELAGDILNTNVVYLVGAVGRAATFSIESGTLVTGLAVTASTATDNRFNVYLFGKRANRDITQGDVVAVTGSLHHQSFRSDDGQVIEKSDVVATSVQLLEAVATPARAERLSRSLN